MAPEASPSPKQAVLDLVARLPDDATYEEIQYRIYVREAIEAGLRDVEEGRVHSQESVERHMQEWIAEYESR